MLQNLGHDIRFALRLISRNRWTSATIIATLTIGIALNVSVFTVLNALLLRPWVRTAPETFMSVIPRFSGEYQLRYSDGGISQPDYAWYRDSARSLESLAAYRLRSLTLGGAESGIVRGGLISCNLFDVIKPGPPILGRYLTADECAVAGDSAVAVLSESFWRNTYGADPQVVGRTIQLNRVPFTVVGVAPAFAPGGNAGGADSDRDVWVPYSQLDALQPSDRFFSDPRAQWLVVVGRRRPDVSLQQVQQELSALARTADERVPGRATALVVTNGSLIQDPELGARAPLLFSVTLGTTTVLLLLACVNVTTLLLSRAAARQHEMAVRVSLGAGRLRLLRQLLTESLVLSGVAAMVSLAIAHRVPAALWSSIVSRPAPFDLTPDWRVLVYGIALAVLAGVIAGLSPAIESLRPGASDTLKATSSAVTSGPRRSLMRSALVAVQVALSLLMLVQAGLFAQAQRQFFSHDPGFETKQVVSVTLESVRGGYQPPASFYQALEARVRALPGVVSTSFSSHAPWAGRSSSALTEIDGTPLPRSQDFRNDPARRQVSRDFFTTLGIPLVQGRFFTADDRPETEVLPTVISNAMARRYWPGKDPVGHRFRTTLLHEVIGVSGNVQSVRYMQDDGPFFYAPLDPLQSNPQTLLIRVSGDTRATMPVVRGIVRQLDPQMAATVLTLASIVEAEGARLKPVAVYGSVAGLLALLLALTGVYGVVSFSVSQRVRELALRVALGAQRRDVVLLVLRSAAGPIAGGLVAGIGLTLAVSGGLQALLYGLNPRDPGTLVLGALLLVVCSLTAIWIPARRAASQDPVRALR
jgi:putative ABC transport system permease protein